MLTVWFTLGLWKRVLYTVFHFTNAFSVYMLSKIATQNPALDTWDRTTEKKVVRDMGII